MRAAPYAEYIERIDILFIQVRDAQVARTRNLGHWRNIDLDVDGNVVAAELIDVTHEGIDLSDIPEREAVEGLIREANVPLELPASTESWVPERRHCETDVRGGGPSGHRRGTWR